MSDRHVQRVHRQLGVQSSAHRPAHQGSRVRVQNRSTGGRRKRNPLVPSGHWRQRLRGRATAGARTRGTEPYHGYFYKILTSQGGDAPGGATSYIVKGKMIGGFALVAYPARWGASGAMTLIVSHDGVVLQKNLGKSTAAIVSHVTRFEPDATWSKAQTP